MGKTGGCATGTEPAGRIVPNNSHTELDLMTRKGVWKKMRRKEVWKKRRGTSEVGFEKCRTLIIKRHTSF